MWELLRNKVKHERRRLNQQLQHLEWKYNSLNMAKIISQETFDDVVQENVVDFSMSPSEAKEETIKQFEAQVRICMRHPIRLSESNVSC